MPGQAPGPRQCCNNNNKYNNNNNNKSNHYYYYNPTVHSVQVPSPFTTLGERLTGTSSKDSLGHYAAFQFGLNT